MSWKSGKRDTRFKCSTFLTFCIILNCREGWHKGVKLVAFYFSTTFWHICWIVWRSASFHFTSFKCLFSRLRSPPLGVLDFDWFILKSIALFALPCLHNSTANILTRHNVSDTLLFFGALNKQSLIRRRITLQFLKVLLMAKIVKGSLSGWCESNVLSLQF